MYRASYAFSCVQPIINKFAKESQAHTGTSVKAIRRAVSCSADAGGSNDTRHSLETQ